MFNSNLQQLMNCTLNYISKSPIKTGVFEHPVTVFSSESLWEQGVVSSNLAAPTMKNAV
jgi:hypothetical protein